MASSRRNFIKGASLTALSAMQGATAEAVSASKDTNIELCLAYFYGLQERKIALSKQMGITGAVSPSSPGAVGLSNVKAWEREALIAVKKAYSKHGLQWRVL